MNTKRFDIVKIAEKEYMYPYYWLYNIEDRSRLMAIRRIKKSENNNDKTNTVKHLDFVERIIDRMSKCSFNLKEYTLTSISVIISIMALFGKNLIIFLLFITVFFWLEDSIYLQYERKYRALYNDVRKKDETEIDFSLDIDNLILDDAQKKNCSYLNCVFSKTETVFYVPIIAILVIAYIVYEKGFIGVIRNLLNI